MIDQKKSVSSLSNLAVTAVLDRIVEFDPVTEKSSSIPFPSAIEIVFRADSEEEVLEAAAMIWCQTVNKAKAQQGNKVPSAFRISALPAPEKPRA